MAHFVCVDVPFLTVLLPLAYGHLKMTSILMKGWLAFARAIERRFTELGGALRYHARVEKLTLDGYSV
jgi:phytoene dehydrogenase-like protein